MPTRARIAISHKSGYTSILVSDHSNAIAQTLLEVFKTPDAVERLIETGDTADLYLALATPPAEPAPPPNLPAIWAASWEMLTAQALVSDVEDLYVWQDFRWLRVSASDSFSLDQVKPLTSRPTVELTLVVRVTDTEALLAHARAQAASIWGLDPAMFDGDDDATVTLAVRHAALLLDPAQRFTEIGLEFVAEAHRILD